MRQIHCLCRKPRCHFSSNDKSAIRRHFYNLKKTCPATKNDIELTDEIKNYILNNRIYKIPKQTYVQNIINNNINNYNQINNLIANMDNLDKVNKFIKYKNIELTDLEESMNDNFHNKVYKLKHNKYKDFQLNLQNIMEIFDEITTINDINKLNILYDDILNKIKIFCDGEWNSFLIDNGIKDIIHKIQSYYLDIYECYIIRKIINEINLRYISELNETLNEYYKFLAWFDITPYVYEKNNNKIMFNSDNDKYFENSNDYSISDEFYNKYTIIATKLNKYDINKVKKGIEMIIKKNSKSFIIDLNKKILNSFNDDESFKTQFINELIQLK